MVANKKYDRQIKVMLFSISSFRWAQQPKINRNIPPSVGFAVKMAVVK